MKTIFLAVLMMGMMSAQAQHREFSRERFHTSHWVYDDRFHHNHYYPALGYSIAVLPPGNVAVNFRGGRFWFHSGVWYQQSGPGYVVVRPPVGIVVPVLPPGYTTVWVGGFPYYYANDVYYSNAPAGGYVVANPPTDEVVAPGPAPVPGPQAAAPQAANWYYCESSKNYYPYVTECKEGWRQVPATPPQK
ncbi:MAG TPA: DUF6515 family protein [Burkholderiales bacterium]|nr:DUF6515 family protein [Burkholderiales bacterium]